MHTVRRRAVLVAPASDEHKARKALASSADEVVLDLEDAVTPDNKATARATAASLVAEFGGKRLVSVRINGFNTEWVHDDLSACAQMGPALATVVLPKAETPAELAEADGLLGDSATRLQALVETPTGVRDIAALCSTTARLDAVIIGYADLGASLGRDPKSPSGVWHPIQETVLIAARAAGISVIDGPHLTIVDDEHFRAAKVWACTLGFDGTWVLHPNQIASATQIFTPDPTALGEARRALAAMHEATQRGAGAVQLDSRMLDAALVSSARRLLAKAGEQ
ncbi:CoA ester lyase [[Mycobacterium] wendilense]|uniref:CoA ester lyase n=1 Tax=[Mycobacterium] wendilense TaxID=3064284 RepID=A0ABN9PAB4_9MYCO|nr:CoA ester lyase [Mycolicibacterium sp. MU0050]CAJ1586002.1 CoA ester lyase [Mycolicibacterium sp. MU0050]